MDQAYVEIIKTALNDAVWCFGIWVIFVKWKM